MTFGEDVILVGYIYGKDANLQQTKTEVRMTVRVEMRDVSRAEYHGLGYGEHKPSLVFDIHAFEYSGQSMLIYQNQTYAVLRTYRHVVDGLELCELTCEKRLA